MRIFSSVMAFFVLLTSVMEAVNLRGADIDCGNPPDVFQATKSFSGRRKGDRVTYKCIKGTYMVGSASATCTEHGSWSNCPPQCRVEYLTKNDNTFKNGDKGYELFSE